MQGEKLISIYAVDCDYRSSFGNLPIKGYSSNNGPRIILSHLCVALSGTFKVYVGNSSRDIGEQGSFTV